jgi:hypothetical protein
MTKPDAPMAWSVASGVKRKLVAGVSLQGKEYSSSAGPSMETTS